MIDNYIFVFVFVKTARLTKNVMNIKISHEILGNEYYFTCEVATLAELWFVLTNLFTVHP